MNERLGVNMGKYGFLALDIDGTVTNTKKEITPAVHEQIKRLQESGIPVALVSGRPVLGMKHVADELNFSQYENCYVLAFNGGKIINCHDDNVVYSQPIELELAKEVCREGKKYDVAVVTYKGKYIISSNPDNKYTQVESYVTRIPVRGVADMEEEIDFCPDKFLFVGEPDYLEKIMPEVQEKFQGRLNIFRSEPFFMEIVPLGIDKAKSLDRLLTMLGLTSEQLVACGDGYNDVSMVDYAGMGVAMANGCEETKAVADYITTSNDEDGVAKAIEKFFI